VLFTIAFSCSSSAVATDLVRHESLSAAPLTSIFLLSRSPSTIGPVVLSPEGRADFCFFESGSLSEDRVPGQGELEHRHIRAMDSMTRMGGHINVKHRTNTQATQDNAKSEIEGILRKVNTQSVQS